MVAGERDPRPRAALRHDRCQKEGAESARALTGPERAEPRFVLQQALALCDFYPTQLSACDTQIDHAFSVMQPRFASAPAVLRSPHPSPPRCKHHSHCKKAPAGTPRAPILRLTGVDLGAGPGISPSSAQTILSEIGTDMSKWPDDKHFCSWLGRAPQNATSGGQSLKRRTMKTRHRAA